MGELHYANRHQSSRMRNEAFGWSVDRMLPSDSSRVTNTSSFKARKPGDLIFGCCYRKHQRNNASVDNDPVCGTTFDDLH